MKYKGLLILKGIIRFLIDVLPLLFWFAVMFAFDLPYVAVLSLISAFIHEAGHIFAMALISRGCSLRAALSGFRLGADSMLSYNQEMAVALAGPLANIVIFMLFSPFLIFGGSEYLATLALINAFTAISNLLPIESYDGYRIIECLICEKIKKTEIPLKLLYVSSFALVCLLCYTSLYFIRSYNGGYWVFFLFFAMLIRTVSKRG